MGSRLSSQYSVDNTSVPGAILNRQVRYDGAPFQAEHERQDGIVQSATRRGRHILPEMLTAT